MEKSVPSTPLSLSGRNYGIDALRLVSILYVLILHFLGQGGILAALPSRSISHGVCWFLEVWAYCAADMFALISGYVSYSDEKKSVRWSGYIMLWLQTVVCGVTVMAAARLLMPRPAPQMSLFASLLPVSHRQYWYFTAYTGLFVIMPLLNAALRACSPRTLRKCFVALFVVFSLFDTYAHGFEFNGGYSFTWIVLLYCMGAIVRKCGIGAKWKARNMLLGIAAFCLIGWLWKLSGLDARLLHFRSHRSFFISYTSPTVLGAAILHLLLFSRMRVGPQARKVIAFAAPGAYAAYLLSAHPVIYNHVLRDKLAFLAGHGAAKILAAVLLMAFAFLAASVCLDRVRAFLFRKLPLRGAADRAAQVAGAAVEKIAARL